MTTQQARLAIEAVWRIEAPRIIGALVRMVGDVAQAEDLAHDALVAALERWPDTGIPDNPGAWLMTCARRCAIDAQRRAALAARKRDGLAHDDAAPPVEASIIDAIDDEVGDDVLRLMLIASHPILPAASRLALTLRLLGGLTTEEIARALLVAAPTIAQRIVRAKRTLAEARVPFEVPRGDALVARLGTLLEVIYLMFNEGYAATAGDAWIRAELCEDAMRLGRILVRLVPHEAEVHGLLALMELQASRFRARLDAAGAPVLLLEQDRARWDHLLIQRGLSGLARAQALRAEPGPYTLQAALAACHARARRAEDTDWRMIISIYDLLSSRQPSPVIALNRLVAISMADGPAIALQLLDEMSDLHRDPLPYLASMIRAELLARLQRPAEAICSLEIALTLTKNTKEQSIINCKISRLESLVDSV